MQMNWKHLTFPALFALTMTISACGDDKVDLCETNPTHPSCTDEVDCEANPEHEDCNTEVDCEADPTVEGCEDYCAENPGAAACLPTDCEAVSEPVITTCTEEEQADTVAHHFNFRDEPAVLPNVEVTGSLTGDRTYKFDARLGSSQTAACQSWLYFNLVTGEFQDISDFESLTSDDWHIAFKRNEIRTNSANSGPRHNLLATTESTDFDEITCFAGVPAFSGSDDFIEAETCEVRMDPGTRSVDGAFGSWYDYDFTTHTTTSPQTVHGMYMVPSHGQGVKLQIESLESNGIYTIRVAPVEITCD